MYYWLTQSLVGKHIVEKQLREALNLKWGYWKRMSLLHQEPVPRLGGMSDEAKKSVKTFYMTESVTLPTKRTVMQDGTQRSVMTKSAECSYQVSKTESSPQSITKLIQETQAQSGFDNG